MMATSLPEDRAESVFEDYKKPYDAGAAAAEANRCLYCLDPPCITACPTGINIPEFIRKIATENVRGSAKTIFDSNILGMSCSRVCPVETLCVGDCVYNRMDQPPIQIGKLQRYATDTAFNKGWSFYEAGADTGKRVALIGAGPASLACAHRLRRFGHATTIFEKREVVGGLNTTGVAPYKMKADRSVEEVEWVLGIGGIDIKTGTEVAGSAVGDMLNDYDAVFVGIGLGPDNHLGVDGEDLQGVHGAVDFIEEFKLNPGTYEHVRHVCVIGGGNTAIDVVREAMGLGAHYVTMVYRGVEAKMSGYHHEWDAAKVEGARAAWQTQPIAYVGADGKVTGVRCVKLDADKNTIEGSEHTLPADLVLVAIGQSKLKDELGQLDGVETNWKSVLCDDVGATGLAGLYVGGDLRNGGMEVVNAVAEGRDAAEAMHRYMTGEG
jgi:dihydropyrimidine dehydrogenase (NAD+) subunit PreT